MNAASREVLEDFRLTQDIWSPGEIQCRIGIRPSGRTDAYAYADADAYAYAYAYAYADAYANANIYADVNEDANADAYVDERQL